VRVSARPFFLLRASSGRILFLPSFLDATATILLFSLRRRCRGLHVRRSTLLAHLCFLVFSFPPCAPPPGVGSGGLLFDVFFVWTTRSMVIASVFFVSDEVSPQAGAASVFVTRPPALSLTATPVPTAFFELSPAGDLRVSRIWASSEFLSILDLTPRSLFFLLSSFVARALSRFFPSLQETAIAAFYLSPKVKLFSFFPLLLPASFFPFLAEGVVLGDRRRPCPSVFCVPLALRNRLAVGVLSFPWGRYGVSPVCGPSVA